MKNDEELKHIPVIAVSGFASSGERDRALSAGFAGFLAKPYMKKELFGHLKAALAHSPKKFSELGKE